MKQIALIGAGSRGSIYADLIQKSGRGKICALVEPDTKRRKKAADAYELPSGRIFERCEDFFAGNGGVDACIIATWDKEHFKPAIAALEMGCDLLLEKPISPDQDECFALSALARKKGRSVVVCHVLRYTPFFETLRNLVHEGSLGRIISIQHNENIGNFHMAHSFVRGNWNNTAKSAPLILAKSCHDLDILTWLADSDAEKVVSFGDLRYFKKENAPSGSSDRCCTCSVRASCRFDAQKIYLAARGEWPANVVSVDQSEEAIRSALETGDYGKCVYRCDNNVCDNQVTLITFKNGVTVTFNLSAFTNKVARTIKIMCEHGEIRGDDSRNEIEVIPFSYFPRSGYEYRKLVPACTDSGHGGGDSGIVNAFLEVLDGKKDAGKTSIDRSIESHLLAFAAEQSRLSGSVVNLDSLRKKA